MRWRCVGNGGGCAVCEGEVEAAGVIVTEVEVTACCSY